MVIKRKSLRIFTHVKTVFYSLLTIYFSRFVDFFNFLIYFFIDEQYIKQYIRVV